MNSSADPMLNPTDHLELGHALLSRLPPQMEVTLTCFLTSEPEGGLTFHARAPHRPGRAGMVTVTRDVLRQQGAEGALPSLTYLLRVAGAGLLPGVTLQERTPLIGVWRVEGVYRAIPLPDRTAPH